MARVVLEVASMRHVWLIATAVASCVPSQSTVFGPVDREVQHRLGTGVTWNEDVHTSSAIDAMLAKPLDLDAAVRIALAHNRRLQARLDELGIAASQVADATVLPPATVDGDYKRALSGSGSEIEVTVVQDVLDLLQIGQRRGIAGAELHAAQNRAVAATVELAAQVEIAFYDAIAAAQDLTLVQTAFDAASTSADLVERQHAAGNANDLALAREQEQRERARIEIGRASQLVEERRARLGSLLGLPEQQKWSTVERLADPPTMTPMLDDLEQVATSSSLDLGALRAEIDAATARHSYAMVRTVLPELGAGVALARRDTGGWEAGPAIRIGIPLFDQQQGPRTRAIAEEHRARNEVAATTVELHAEAQTARSRALQTFAEVRQLVDVVMPLRKRVLDETVLHYNAMNASTFELLIARREMVDIGRQYIEAMRRYWIAMAEVQALRRGGRAMAMTGGSR